MKLIQQRWANWQGKFDALSRRERAMISGAILVGVIMIGSTSVVEPLTKRQTLLEKRLVEKTDELSKLRLQLYDVQARVKQDPNATQRAELATLEKQLRQFDEDIKTNTAALVPPNKMNALLERILGRQKGLQVVSLKSLPPVSVLGLAGGKKDLASASVIAQGFNLYRHGVEIKIAGTYADLQHYLEQLEKENQKLLWGEVTISTKEYPTAVLTLVVYTLSPEQTWLSI